MTLSRDWWHEPRYRDIVAYRQSTGVCDTLAKKKKKNVTVIQNSLSWWPRRIRHLTMEQEILGSKSQAGLVEPVPAQNLAATHAHHAFFFVLYDAWVWD